MAAKTKKSKTAKVKAKSKRSTKTAHALDTFFNVKNSSKRQLQPEKFYQEFINDEGVAVAYHIEEMREGDTTLEANINFIGEKDTVNLWFVCYPPYERGADDDTLQDRILETKMKIHALRFAVESFCENTLLALGAMEDNCPSTKKK